MSQSSMFGEPYLPPLPPGFPYPNPNVTVTASTFTFPEPEPEVGYDDKKSAKENLARAMFEIAKQLRLSREQAQQSSPVWPAPQQPAYPWWPLQQTPYPKEWEPYITCSTIGACNER